MAATFPLRKGRMRDERSADLLFVTDGLESGKRIWMKGRDWLRRVNFWKPEHSSSKLSRLLRIW